MVVKSATKKKLMDLGIAEEYAHRLADDRKWDDVKVLAAGEIAQICATDSGMAQKISEVIQGSTKAAQKVQATEKTLIRRRVATRRRKKSVLPLQEYDSEDKMPKSIVIWILKIRCSLAFQMQQKRKTSELHLKQSTI